MRYISYTLMIAFSCLLIKSEAKNIDSLQKQLDTATNDHVKAKLYTNIADELIQFNGQKTREITYAEAGKAVGLCTKKPYTIIQKRMTPWPYVITLIAWLRLILFNINLHRLNGLPYNRYTYLVTARMFRR